jgi:hypothetical protein
MPSTQSRARTERRALRRAWVIVLAIAACRFDPAYRDVPESPPVTCTPGVTACNAGAVATCASNGAQWTVVDDCAARSLACAPGLVACTPCLPGDAKCDDAGHVTTCTPDGRTYAVTDTCDASQGIACRAGACVDLCDQAAQDHSNVGCEYWPVDLPNADIAPNNNAAAQQYAVVVSNPQPDVPAVVTVDEDDSAPGATPAIRTVATATIAPLSLEVFKLGPREVTGNDGAPYPPIGTGTMLSRHAFRVRSNVPIAAYQFNPLDNVNVFSNDASQLLPTEALGGGGGRAYVVAGWPQTIAVSVVPGQDFGIDLRAFLTIVGTKPDTHVHVKSAAHVIPGGPLATDLPQGGELDVTLQPFDVLNLETGDFNADFTGSLIDADQPVAVYPGSECSDAPSYGTLANRACCCDHLEQQLVPVRAVGTSYAIARMPNRTRAVAAAGAQVTPVDEPEYYRVVAALPGTTHVTTTLPAPDDAFDLGGEGADRLIEAHQDFLLTASQAAIVEDVQASQQAAGLPLTLPGGDPSMVFPTPIEQWRSDYVLLTPDKYAFDFLVITAPYGANVYIDGTHADTTLCEVADADGRTPQARGADHGPYTAYRCQLSFPIVDPTKSEPNNVQPGRQNDGVHHVQADRPVGVIAYGFDLRVSYAYAGGTQLTAINVR